jgi:type I restriction enzyme S subunit
MEEVIKHISKINFAKRWDYRFHQRKFSNLEQKLDASIYPLYFVEQITDQVIDGTHFTPQYTDNSGVLFLMTRNVRPHEITLNNVSYITYEEHQKLIRCKPEPGDVLVTKDGTIGIAAVVPDTLPEFNIFVSLIKIRPKSVISPHYLAAFINSELGQLQIKQQIKGAAITHIHLEDMRRIRIPVPPRSLQDQIAQVMQEAYGDRQRKLEESAQSYQKIINYVFEELGINLTAIQRKRNALVSISLLQGGRFDFEAVVTLQDISSQFTEHETTLLKEIAEQINERITPSIDFPNKIVNYIGLANIQSNSGELANFEPVRGAGILSASPKFKKGDILFGRMRPYLNKVWIAEFDGICSGEALVFRPNQDKVDTQFLQALLLSQLTLDQVVPLQSGSSLPRVSSSDVLNIKLPIPKDLQKQKEIGSEVKKRRSEAKRLRTESEAVVAAAKSRVERMILGEE